MLLWEITSPVDKVLIAAASNKEHPLKSQETMYDIRNGLAGTFCIAGNFAACSSSNKMFYTMQLVSLPLLFYHSPYDFVLGFCGVINSLGFYLILKLKTSGLCSLVITRYWFIILDKMGSIQDR